VLVHEKRSIYLVIELSLREISYVLYAHALMCALMTLKSCAVAMRNAIPRNHLKQYYFCACFLGCNLSIDLPFCQRGLTQAIFHRDRFRTTVNVLGDSIGAGVVEHLSRDDLRKYDVNGIVDDRAPLSKLEKGGEPDHVVVTSAL